MRVIFILLLVYLSLNAFSNELLDKGRNHYYSGNFEMAKVFLERAYKSITNDEIILMLGNSYLATKDYKKALEIFKTGTMFSSRDWIFEFNLAYLYYVSGDFSNSVKHFISVRDKNPKFPKTYWFGGMSSIMLLDVDTTISLWEDYLRLAPNGEESDNIRKALELLKTSGTNAIPEIVAKSKDTSDNIEELIKGIENGFEIKSEKRQIEDTSLEEIEK
ncbi:MAG: hypothetical protein N2712_01470 [Brevinematales bacterium]|nr:hypothetical protein [Brevinematales bacterium]